MVMPNVTTLLATYGAFLSTALGATAIWDRRRTVKVDVDFDHSPYEEDNFEKRGIRVTVTNSSRHMVSVEAIGISPNKGGSVQCNVADRRWPEGYPLDLPPGHRVSVSMGFDELLPRLEQGTHADAVREDGRFAVRGVCRDGNGKIKYSARQLVLDLRE